MVVYLSEYVKVYLRVKNNPKIAYCKDSFGKLSLSKFQENVIRDFPELENLDWTMYWIDDENDEIELKDNQSYNYFQAAMLDKKKKIYIKYGKNNANLPQTAESVLGPTSDSLLPKSGGKSNSEKQPHPGVFCGGCNSLIFGFRYKCVQCLAFDLCGKCEGEMLHNEHVMFRIPIPLDTILLKKRNRGNRRHYYSRQNLYTMMHDLTKSTDATFNESHTNEKCGRRSKTDNKYRSKENDFSQSSSSSDHSYFSQQFINQYTDKKCGKKNKTESTSSATDNSSSQSSSSTPLNDNNFSSQQFMDPNYTQAGIQFLNNFSQIFGKMLNPLGINDEIVIAAKDNASDPTNLSKSDEPLPNPATNNKIEKRNDEIKNSEDSFDERNNLKEESKAPSVDDESNSDKFKFRRVAKNDSYSVDKVVKQQQLTSSNSVSPTADCIYESSSHIWKQVQNEEAKAPVEIRTQIIHHHKPSINNAIIAMSAMGYNNEGNWLTGLLESVDGYIPKALDLLQQQK